MVRIPVEYQEVEYLESVGGQYINLPYGFADTDEVEITASELSGNNDKYMIAPSQWNDNKNRFSMVGQYSNSFAVGFGAMGTTAGRFTPYQRSDKLVHTWTYQNRKFEITDLGATESVSSTAFNAETKYLRLFYGYNASSKGRIYSYKHKKANGDEYIFIPCYRKSDNEPGMYDTVSGTFFTNSGTGAFLVGNDVEYSTVSLLEARRKILLNTPHLTSASGQLATFNTDLSAPLKKMKVHFYPVQASGTPSPDNVLPISGWDGVTVTMPKGKNFIPPDDPLNPMEHYYHTSTGRIAYSEEEDAFYSDGSGVGYTNHLTKGGSHMLFEAPTDMTATFSVYYKNVGTNYGLRFYYNNSRVQDIHGTADSTWHRYTYTRSMKKGDWITFSIYGNIYFKDIQIEYGSEATEYETHVEPTSIPITFPQTIYGGYVDLVKGEVVETYGSDGQPITPRAYPIQAQTIKTLKGINNIFSDANGNVDVTYWKH